MEIHCSIKNAADDRWDYHNDYRIVEGLGIRENEFSQCHNKLLYEWASATVERINAILGNAANPQADKFPRSHYFAPAIHAFFDICKANQGYRAVIHVLSVGSQRCAKMTLYIQGAETA